MERQNRPKERNKSFLLEILFPRVLSLFLSFGECTCDKRQRSSLLFLLVVVDDKSVCLGMDDMEDGLEWRFSVSLFIAIGFLIVLLSLLLLLYIFWYR